ncbi:adenylosuccinate lyase [Streptococcus alactolyticus]|uniref:Adenylosuccinate lyase n=1 Tax=Streptococcus alactolyticus TaxID=29389 RepID=A0ABY7LYP8_STRAY|nr:adenylosuccinate lyase [Streptococcus alactolyticus]WBB05742.1 adenylosuccinate lyase [Streptococcus alactolyticus]GLB79575.1 adenylosuccinate lyase [Streptococcus alactolyticus]
MTSVLDSILLQNNFSTPEIRLIWSDENKVSKQLAVEVALAKIEGELGIIPKTAAQQIIEKAKVEHLNLLALQKESAQKRHSLIALIHALQELVGTEAGEYVHYGVTTQDIVDTGIMLQTKEAYDVIVQHSKALIQTVAALAQKHRSTLMMGRTHGIHAIPITFGVKLAIWLDELLRNHKRLRQLECNEVFVGSISGAVGTYAAFDGRGIEVERLTLAELGLVVPNISWQPSRDRFSEFATTLGIYAGTLGKIGHELFTLMKTEINEIHEPFRKGEIGSSTMPQKRNPALIEGVASLTQPIFSDDSVILQSMLIDGERDAIHWRNEWVALPEITSHLDAQLVQLTYILSELEVNTVQMRKNLDIQGSLPYSERIMFKLGKVIGKQTAHELVYQAAMKAIENHDDFISLLYQEPTVSTHFSKETIQSWIVPENNIGENLAKVDDVVSTVQVYFRGD